MSIKSDLQQMYFLLQLGLLHRKILVNLKATIYAVQ